MIARDMSQPSFLHADGGDNHAIALIAAVAASLAVHAVLGWFARDAKLELPGDAPGLTPAQRLALRRETAMRVSVAPDPAERPETPEGVFEPPPEPRAATSDPEELLAVADTGAPSVLFDPPPIPEAADPAAVGVAPPEAADAPRPEAPWQPREEVIEISSKFANDDVAAIPRAEIPAIDRISGAPDVVPESTVAAAIEAASLEGGSFRAATWMPAPPAPGEVEQPQAFAESSGEGSAADAPPDLGETAEPETEPEAFFAEVPEEVAPAKPIEDVLAASVSVFRPRRGDYVYFEVGIRRKGADVLPAIPRDVVFAQDASRSIAPQRLVACREALKRAFRSGLLREGDRFEVTAFNTTNVWAFGRSWRAATPEAVEEAVRFVDSIRPDGNTDLYSAARSVLSLPRSPERAVIAILVSDGVATQGDIRRDSEIIGEFSRENDGVVSVFGVGVSPRSDEYLLSMLSLCNRGGPAVLPRDRFSIPDALVGTFSEIGTPVLSGIRFSFDTASDAVVAPKRTENLYLERPLRLFGRARADAGEIVFQARGENAGRAYDMVFDISLGTPAPGQGDPTIATRWARARIYDLVAEHIRSGEASALAEMAEIGREHGVPIPFKEKFR